MEDAVRFVEQSPDPTPQSLYEDVYVRSPYINMKAAEKDPAWRAAVREDRVPETLPPPVLNPPPPSRRQKDGRPAPDPATAAAQATAKVGS
jgi:hypothetical protein